MENRKGKPSIDELLESLESENEGYSPKRSRYNIKKQNIEIKPLPQVDEVELSEVEFERQKRKALGVGYTWVELMNEPNVTDRNYRASETAFMEFKSLVHRTIQQQGIGLLNAFITGMGVFTEDKTTTRVIRRVLLKFLNQKPETVATVTQIPSIESSISPIALPLVSIAVLSRYTPEKVKNFYTYIANFETEHTSESVSGAIIDWIKMEQD
ncbi:hypothetical protein HYZ78_03935 [Candidatus Microgenomates bacterium]|nr:hypothetical protein [Candidatus Microgenomates bacterium]